MGQQEFGSVLIRPDESLYTQISLEMYNRHEWLIPYLQGKPSFVKPPLVYWLEELSFLVFGESLWAARLPVWILGLCSAWLAYGLGKLLYSKQIGVCAALLFFCNVFFFQYSQADMMDVPLTFFVLLSFFAFVLAVHKHKPWLYLCGVSLGISTLVKGPVGIVLGLIPICWHCAAYGSWRILRSREALGAVLLGIFTSILWPYALWREGYGKAWFDQFVLGENFGKFSGQNMSFEILFIGLLGGLVPWTFLFLESFIKGIREIRNSPEKRFALGWIVSVLLLFALPLRKLPHYVMPAFPASAFLMAGTKDFSRLSRTMTSVLLGVIGLFSFLCIRLTFFPTVRFCFVAAGIAALVSGCVLQKKSNPAPSAFFFGITLLFLPVIFPALQLSGQGRAVKCLVKEGFSIGVYCPTDQDPRGFEISPKFFSCGTPGEAQEFLRKGGILIYSQRYAAVFRKFPLKVQCTWYVWKRGLGLGKVLKAVLSGDPSSLQEKMTAGIVKK